MAAKIKKKEKILKVGLVLFIFTFDTSFRFPVLSFSHPPFSYDFVIIR